MKEFLDMCHYVASEGDVRQSRVGPVRSIFGLGMGVDLRQGFPLVTTRNVNYAPVLGELAAFLRGAVLLSEFKRFGCHYWDENCRAWDKDGKRVGRIYGAQWRQWLTPDNEVIDQLDELVQGLRDDPMGRRHVLTAWNPGEMGQMCLPPCHILAQWYVNGDDSLDCLVYMRSVDLCLGFPSDMVLYGALHALVAKSVGRTARAIHWRFGDGHIYENHIDQLVEQVQRAPKPAPQWKLDPASTINNFVPAHLTIEGYDPWPALRYQLNT
jgi:thymidylate synthase